MTTNITWPTAEIQAIRERLEAIHYDGSPSNTIVGFRAFNEHAPTDIRTLLDALDRERSVAIEAATLMAREEVGFNDTSRDNLLDALQQAGYTEDVCGQLMYDAMPSRDEPNDVTP